MNSPDHLYITHMLECMEDIQAHISAATQLGANHWGSHITTREAVYRSLHTLAESGDRLSETVRHDMPEVPWHQVKGLRNILVHEYPVMFVYP